MKKTTALLSLIFLTSAAFANELDCTKDAVDFYWKCHQNSLDKAMRGNSADLDDKKCENLLYPKLQKCFGVDELKPTPCQEKAVNKYFNCQTNLNQKFQQGNLSAGRSDECGQQLLDEFKACGAAGS